MDIIRRLKHTLSNTGLTDEEIAFYVNTAKNPGSSIYDLAKRSKIPKDRAYKIFGSLTEKNLIKARGNRNKKVKIAPLNTFIENLYSEGRSSYRNADALKEMHPFIPFLSVQEKHDIKSIEHERLGEFFVDISELKWEKVLAYGNFEMGVEVMGGMEPDIQFVKNRLKRGKKCLPVLANPGKHTLEVVKNDDKELRKTKVIFNDKLTDHFVLIMPDLDKVAVFHKSDNGIAGGALIDSSMITKLHENIFNHLNDISEYHRFRELEKLIK